MPILPMSQGRDDRDHEALEALQKPQAHINPGNDLPEPFQALRQKLEAPLIRTGGALDA